MGFAKYPEVPMPEYMAVKRESKGLKKSCMPALLFFALVASLRFLVWMPSFFMVMGLSTCNKEEEEKKIT